ncbi:SH3 domain-containing protein [Fretibacter rubidus]|uniref:SH3 domain-containing protein n=1 Tax=Fretibacter rubidus TaxID=570162 RepID=UPI00352A7B17
MWDFQIKAGVFCLIAALTVSGTALAQDAKSHTTLEKATPPMKRVVKPLPNTNTVNTHKTHRAIYRVGAANTPSGFEVPRYVSLKFSKTNGRSGPSMEHSVLWQYRKRGLPVIVVAETEQWRKIRDINGEEAWVYLSGLSGQRNVITTAQIDILKRPKVDAPLIAIAQKDAVLQLDFCEDSWCRVIADGKIKGWAKRDTLWGANPLF